MIRLKTSISVLDKFLSLNNIRGVMINSLVNFKILELLMKAAGYDQVTYMFIQKSLRKLIEEYRLSQMDLLDDSYQKRSNVRDCRARLHSLIFKLENYDVYKDIWTIEKIIEESKETYYEALQDSSINWHENKNDYKPFVNYMLGVIVSAYKEFESRVKLLTDPNISKADRIREMIKNHIGTITKSELLEMNPDISDTTVQRALADLLKAGEIEKIGGGRYTKYAWKAE